MNDFVLMYVFISVLMSFVSIFTVWDVNKRAFNISSLPKFVIFIILFCVYFIIWPILLFYIMKRLIRLVLGIWFFFALREQLRTIYAPYNETIFLKEILIMFMNLLLGYLLIGRIVGVMMVIKMVYSRLEDKCISIIQELIGLKFSRFCFF